MLQYIMSSTFTPQKLIDNLNKKHKTSGYLIIEDFDKNLETGTKVLISLPYQIIDAQTKKSN